MRFQLLCDGCGKSIAVDGQRRTGGHLVIGSRRDDQTIQATHFFVKHANSIPFMVVRPEGVGADKLCEMIGFMRMGAFDAAHFVKNDGYAEIGSLPGCFRSGHAAADNMDRFDTHCAKLGKLAQASSGQMSAARVSGRTKIDLPNRTVSISGQKKSFGRL